MTTAPTTPAAVREAPHHRNLTCYTDYHCRRPDCVTRYNTHVRAQKQAKADGTWNRYIDAAPVREHLQHLTGHGLTLGRIATVTGVPLQTLCEITGRRYRTSPDHAQAILAVTPDAVTPTLVDATGTRRRLQALVAAGWPLEHLAPHVGLHPRDISNFTRRARVKAGSAAAVADAYTRLARRKPYRRGITATQAKRARRRAAANRWPTPKYWDQHPGAIDDPDFVPDYGKTRLEILAEDAHWLIAFGMTRDAAAKQLGADPSYVDRALAAHPEAVTA